MHIIEETGHMGFAGVAVIALLSGAAGGCGNGSGGSPAPVHNASGAHDASAGDASGSGSGGGSSSGTDGGPRSDGGSSGSDGAPGGDGGMSDGSGSGGDGDNGCSASTPVALTALNSGCSVGIGSMPESNSNTQTICVPAGAVTVKATPASSAFAIGADPWFGVDQNAGGAAPGTDKGAGATETTTATVTVSTGDHCVSVCCGNAPGGTGCPATNPCP
jgi:hypothetical protein